MGMRILSTLQTGRIGRPEEYRRDRSGHFGLWWFGLALSLSTFCSFAQFGNANVFTAANEIDTIIIPAAVPAGGSIRFPVEIDISAVASFPRDICFAINVRELATPPLSVLADFPAVTNGIFECSFANNVQCVRIECTPPDLFSR